MGKITLKKWDQNQKQTFFAAMTIALILLSSFALGRGAAAYAGGNQAQTDNGKICVVIDAGHGGSQLR